MEIIRTIDLCQRMPRPRPKAKEAEEVLALLADYDYLRVIPARGMGKPMYEVNPGLF